jgi:hypothetical protein
MGGERGLTGGTERIRRARDRAYSWSMRRRTPDGGGPPLETGARGARRAVASPAASINASKRAIGEANQELEGRASRRVNFSPEPRVLSSTTFRDA